MPDELVRPFVLKYEGRETDQHIIQAELFGDSVLGAARFYTAVAHFCFYGTVPRGRYKKDFACFTAPTRPGSVDQLFFVAPIAGQYALHAAIYNEAFSYIFGQVCDSIKNIWTRPSEMTTVVEQLTSALKEQAKVSAEVQTQLAGGLVQANDQLASLHSKLIDTLPAIAAAQRSQGVRLVAPVGVSCSSLAQFAGTELESRITEADAEVIRGDDAMEVDDEKDFQVSRIKEINLTTGHCIVDVEGLGEISGRITDPALKAPNNVYTRALDSHVGCLARAKTVRKNGIAHQLFISDAKL